MAPEAPGYQQTKANCPNYRDFRDADEEEESTHEQATLHQSYVETVEKALESGLAQAGLTLEDLADPAVYEKITVPQDGGSGGQSLL